MTYNYKDKKKFCNDFNNYMLNKTISMFEYSELAGIPNKALENILQTMGYAFITEHEGKLFAFSGGLGGELDEYGQPTEITVSVPYLKLNKKYNLLDDGVLIKNDTQKMGLLPLFERVAFLLSENDINFILQGYAIRTNKLISASDDKTKQSAENFLKQAVDGELAIIGENAIFEGLKLQSTPQGNSNQLANLIQYAQFLRNGLYSELGINTDINQQHKKANLLKEEVEQSQEMVFPLVYNMLQCRQEGIKALNQKYNLQSGVCFGSIWGIKYGEHFNSGANKMLYGEYLEQGNLWQEIKTAAQESQHITSLFDLFDVEKLNKQSKVLYGEKELYKKFQDVPLNECAELVLLQYAEQWEKIPLLPTLPLGATEKETTTETTESTTETQDKTSAFNDDALIVDGGEDEIKNQVVTTETIKTDALTLEKELTLGYKGTVTNTLLENVASFLTLTVYPPKTESEE